MIHAYKLIGTNLPNRILCRMNKSIHPLFALRHGVAQLLLWSAFYYLLPALLPLLRAEGVPTEAVSAAISGALLLWALTLPVAGSLVDKGHGVLLMRGGGLLGCLLMVLALVLPRQVALVPIVLLGFTMASTLYDPCFALLLRTRGLDASGANNQGNTDCRAGDGHDISAGFGSAACDAMAGHRVGFCCGGACRSGVAAVSAVCTFWQGAGRWIPGRWQLQACQ